MGVHPARRRRRGAPDRGAGSARPVAVGAARRRRLRASTRSRTSRRAIGTCCPARSTPLSRATLSNAGVIGRAVIREFASQPTPTLADFERVFCSLHDGARVAVRYVLPLSQHQEPRRRRHRRPHVVWGRRLRAQRADGAVVGAQPAPPPPTPPPVPRPVRFAFTGPEHVQRVTPSLVRVLFDIPYQIDGVAGLKYIGAGVVVDAKRGLVLVDRNTVPVALGDVRVEFACTVEVAATARFLHPTHNFAVVEYDPAAIDGDCVASAELSASPLEVGEECTFVGTTAQFWRNSAQFCAILRNYSDAPSTTSGPLEARGRAPRVPGVASSARRAPSRSASPTSPASAPSTRRSSASTSVWPRGASRPDTICDRCLHDSNIFASRIFLLKGDAPRRCGQPTRTARRRRSSMSSLRASASSSPCRCSRRSRATLWRRPPTTT